MAFNHSLAVYTPSIGTPSETFIRRHIEELAPGKTVVICDTILEPPIGNWSVDIPIYCTTTRINWSTRLIRRNLCNGRLIPFIDPLLLFLKKHAVRTILAEYMDQSLYLFRLLSGSGIDFYVHAHGQDMSRRLQQQEFRHGYLEYAKSAGIISCSQYGKRKLADLGLPENKIHVVNYGVVALKEYPNKPPEADIVRCVAVGRMTNIKAPLLLLEAFRRATLSNDKLHLDYIGGGELFAMAFHYVRIWKLQERVKLYGVQPATFVAKTMREADVFLQHSVTDPISGAMEGLPVAILEAMAQGLPVVSTRHSGIPEEVVHEETGILVEQEDVDGMASAILRLANNPSLRKSMGYAGYNRALENFTWEKNRDELISLMNLYTEKIHQKNLSS